MEAFTWMFRIEGFKKHYIFLCASQVILLLLACALGAAALFSTEFGNLIVTVVLGIAAVFFFASTGLLPSGYFWCLTCSLAERQRDFIFSDVYDGTYKEIITVELPELKPFAFIWRGFASIVATTLLIYPVLILLAIVIAGSFFTGFAHLTEITISYGILFLFIGFLIPGLLWNYAVRDSVIAVWNVPKAIHLMGTYPGKYFGHAFVYLMIAFLWKIIITWSVNTFGLSFVGFDYTNIFEILKFCIIYLLLFFGANYILYVYAYLLGTIAPSGEI